MTHKIEFILSDEEYEVIIAGKLNNSWVTFCLTHPNVQNQLVAVEELKQMRKRRNAV